MSNKKYLITGGSGFIGTKLCEQLLDMGHELFVLTRNSDKTQQHFLASLGEASTAIQLVNDLASFDENVDIVINLAGQGVLDKRWNDEVKQQLLDSRLLTTKAVSDYIQRVDQKPEAFISGSAIGYYGIEHGDKALDETEEGDSSFSSQLCSAWEQEAQAVEALGVRVCYLRTGVVLENGGALAKMLPPFKLGLGGPVASGQQWMSWIHRDDLLGMIHYLSDHQISGAVNGTAPDPVTNKDFTSTLAKVLKRPAFFPMPEFVLKVLFGEGGVELLANGQRVIPTAMQKAGYQFKYPQLKGALEAILING